MPRHTKWLEDKEDKEDREDMEKEDREDTITRYIAVTYRDL